MFSVDCGVIYFAARIIKGAIKANRSLFGKSQLRIMTFCEGIKVNIPFRQVT